MRRIKFCKIFLLCDIQKDHDFLIKMVKIMLNAIEKGEGIDKQLWPKVIKNI